MNRLWLLLMSLVFIAAASSNTDRCLTDYPEVNPKKYFDYNGTSLEIKIETSDRMTHQLSTWVFYYFIKEVVGYAKIKVVHERDDFQTMDVLRRMTDTYVLVANTTINLEVWISPDYDTYVTDLVKECGSVSPPGRFGWFIPISMTKPIQNYFNPDNMSDIKSIHWRHFRDRKFVDNFHIADSLLEILHTKGYTKQRDNQEYVCPAANCTRSLYVPKQCEYEICAVLLTSEWSAMQFVLLHIRENNLYVKVLFLGPNLLNAVNYLKGTSKLFAPKSLVILSWTPSDVILYDSQFVTVSFESGERMKFTQLDAVGYKYEMHRLVKVAWNKMETSAKPLYETLRSFKFEVPQYKTLMDMYDKNRNLSYKKIACMWMKQYNHTWLGWQTSKENIIYIGGIFPMSGSSYAGQGIARASVMAMKAINENSTILNGYSLKILITDGMCRADNVMKNFIDFIVDQEYYKNLVGVLGPACSDTVEPLAGVSRHYRIMVISYSAEGSSFSNREKYPFFFRTIGENKHYKYVYQELFKYFKWKRVAALTEDGQKYTEYISLMQDELEKNGITFIANKKFPRERETEPMTRYLEDLKSKRARIIIADVVDEIARQVMCEAYKLSMTASEGYVWFLPMWLNSTWYNTDYFNTNKNETVNCTTAEMIKAITGYFSMTHAYYAPDNQTMQENKTVGEWYQTYQHASPPNAMSDYGGFAYDAVWVYALALDKLSKVDPEALSDIHSVNTTNKLVKMIEQTDFYGVSGRIKFRGGPSRFSIIKILQWYENDTHLIGEFYPDLTDDKPEILGGELQVISEKIRWYTSDGNVPKDGKLPPPVCAIEGIAQMFNVECQTAMIILNVMVAIFLGMTVMGVCLYLKIKYDMRVKSQKEYMEKLGIRYDDQKHTPNLEAFEVAQTDVDINRILGEGAFGTVYGGQAKIPSCGITPVAVKTLKKSMSIDDRIDFLSEADNMKNFDHKNVIKLLGVVTKSLPLATIMEYCLFGDLKNYLLARRHLANTTIEGSGDVTPKRLTNMALDIARGLSYLRDAKFVHRDLACRNCMVNAQRIVKIGDFGMTRPMNSYESYHLTRKGMLPVRWMAPESLLTGTFTSASDVWSFGVVLYEIITFGCTPFYGKDNTVVVDMVLQGAQLEIPKGAKPQLAGLMKSCWSPDPKDRPLPSAMVEYIANAPKLLTPCMDIPAQFIKLGEDEDNSKVLNTGFGMSKFNFRKKKGKKWPFIIRFNRLRSKATPKNSITTCPDESSVSIQLENVCSPKEPLLGRSKSISSLMTFGKFNMQNNRRDSGCQGEDEGFSNSPANSYINSKL
ncbi:atrial natriuretic peptide receptor 2 [Dendroctonus ponderosae]|uniref:Gamma-aminobutyric acid type B receptor subunit 2 n=1 Tax=Dendroctonus ponderosae TaxID=77166 RepID=A0AAR5PJY5_DENPD|nr:atrial natriuretic peptide receptor 2 [Dendroctonus ponderosae]XP_019761348.1 atrial natriuretic peptide receptor 2 [Dendroctonus ponderosae]XP_048520559.1 atrial natriuretic peptide receptor 2 [Dendroctonus ponderosae]KAH1013429.1 hypothetical protein HUJ04_002414 [Dendroctonus ponderosae]